MHRQEEAKGLRKGWIIASVFLALMLVLSACGGGQKTGSESDKNVLRVGTDAAYPPLRKAGRERRDHRF